MENISGPDDLLDQFHHLLLSAGLYWYFDIDEDDLKDICLYPNRATRSLWLTDDLNNVISLRNVPLKQILSDDAKLVITHGELFTTCTSHHRSLS